MKQRTQVSTTALAFLAALLAGCGHQDGNPDAAGLPTATVRIAPVQLMAHQRSQLLPGTVHPADQAVIASKLMATVATADVAIGQQVAMGEVLISLKADEIAAQVEQARAALAQVERNYEREKSLLAQSATTAETVRTLEDQRRLAKARLEEALTMESYLKVRAPFDGIITSKQVRRGDLARPGMPLLSIEGAGLQQVYVQVPESLSARDHASDIEIEADGTTVTARLTEWSPAADPASRTRLAKLDLPESAELRSGQYVRVSWPAGETESVWIPRNALSVSGQMERVFVLVNDQLQLRLIRTGGVSEDKLQVLSGLTPGEMVVINPSTQLMDGQPASIQQ